MNRAPATINLDACLRLSALLAALPPSLNHDLLWLRDRSKRGARFTSSEYTGKWCIPLTESEVDDAWARIKGLLKRGKLLCAKVSTAAGRKRTGHANFVIIAYTADWSDREDVNRTREVLRSAGFATTLGYKRDLETMQPHAAFEFIYPDF
jgi:hypothetical protein